MLFSIEGNKYIYGLLAKASSEGSHRDEKLPTRPKVTSRPAVDYLELVIDFSMNTQHIQVIETANKLMSMLENHRVEQAGKQR